MLKHPGAHRHSDGPLDVMFLEKDMELLPPPIPDQGKDEKIQTAEGGRRISLYRTAR